MFYVFISIAEHLCWVFWSAVCLLEGRIWIEMCKSLLTTSKSPFITCHIMLTARQEP